MIKKFLGSLLFAWIFLFAQVVSAADFETATEAAKNLSAEYYANAKGRAFEFAELRTYSDHGEHHAALVAIKSQEAADAVERAGLGNPYYSSISCAYNRKSNSVREVFKVLNGKSFPLSTQNCIEERLGELDTMKKFPVEAHIQIVGDYSKNDKKKISRMYSRYCKDATRKHQFPVTFEFIKE